jgi:hypothetical protein
VQASFCPCLFLHRADYTSTFPPSFVTHSSESRLTLAHYATTVNAPITLAHYATTVNAPNTRGPLSQDGRGSCFFTFNEFDAEIRRLHGQLDDIRYRAQEVLSGTGNGSFLPLLKSLPKRIRQAPILRLAPTAEPRNAAHSL